MHVHRSIISRAHQVLYLRPAKPCRQHENLRICAFCCATTRASLLTCKFAGFSPSSPPPHSCTLHRPESSLNLQSMCHQSTTRRCASQRHKSKNGNQRILRGRVHDKVSVLPVVLWRGLQAAYVHQRSHRHLSSCPFHAPPTGAEKRNQNACLICAFCTNRSLLKKRQSDHNPRQQLANSLVIGTAVINTHNH